MRYDIKIYDKDRHFTVEHETIRNLTYTQMLTITQVLTRYGIIYHIEEIKEEGEEEMKKRIIILVEIKNKKNIEKYNKIIKDYANLMRVMKRLYNIKRRALVNKNLKGGNKMKKENKFTLSGSIIVSLWNGGTGWKWLNIETDENGLLKIKKNPLQDYISFGVESIDYASFDVYKTKIEKTGDKVITTQYKTPILKIEAGKFNLSEKEEKEYIQDGDIANITY